MHFVGVIPVYCVSNPCYVPIWWQPPHPTHSSIKTLSGCKSHQHLSRNQWEYSQLDKIIKLSTHTLQHNIDRIHSRNTFNIQWFPPQNMWWHYRPDIWISSFLQSCVRSVLADVLLTIELHCWVSRQHCQYKKIFYSIQYCYNLRIAGQCVS